MTPSLIKQSADLGVARMLAFAMDRTQRPVAPSSFDVLKWTRAMAIETTWHILGREMEDDEEETRELGKCFICGNDCCEYDDVCDECLDDEARADIADWKHDDRRLGL